MNKAKELIKVLFNDLVLGFSYKSDNKVDSMSTDEYCLVSVFPSKEVMLLTENYLKENRNN